MFKNRSDQTVKDDCELGFIKQFICSLAWIMNQLMFSFEGKRINLFNKIQDILVVNKFNVAPINLLFRVFFLFHFEDVLEQSLNSLLSRKYDKLKLMKAERSQTYLIKMLLQLLICEINTELFKTAQLACWN